jgi:hypothetical protein
MTDTEPASANGVTIGEIYKEQYAHFRAMNDVLYKIPPIFTVVVGSLWYFAVQNIDKEPVIAGAVFAFAAFASFCFVIVMERFRAAFNGYIGNLNKMDGAMRVSIRSSCLPSTIKTVQLLLWLAMPSIRLRSRLRRASGRLYSQLLLQDPLITPLRAR